MESTIIKNDKQVFFNQVKGIIHEMNESDDFCNVVLMVGHENNRHISFVTKKLRYDQLKSDLHIGDKVCIKFYLSSRKKHERWYTTATILDIQKEL